MSPIPVAMIKELSQVKLKSVIISGHMEREKRIERFQKCAEAGIVAYWQVDVDGNASNLANQLVLDNAMDNNRQPMQNPATGCKFLREQMCCVLWNGDLVACCFDYEGHTKFGNINDANALELFPKVSSLCSKCPGHPSN